MKKLVFLFSLLVACAVNAQDNYFTTYRFIVEPQNVATVQKLVEDYYSKNKPEGVFVRLFENHFHDGGNMATHALVFTGTQEAVGNMYAGGPNDSFALFLTRLNQHIKDGAGAIMGRDLAVHGVTNNERYPFQRYYMLDVKDTEAFDAAHNKLHAQHTPPGVIVDMGNIISGQAPNGPNRWVIVGFKDMKSAMGGVNSLLTGKTLADREKAWDEFVASNGGVEVLRTGMRILLGAW